MSNRAKTFTNFPKLPIEIRQTIWGYVCQIPRVVNITTSNQNNGPNIVDYSCVDDRSSLPWTVTASLTSSTPVPALLHVSQESRDAGLKFYKWQLPYHGGWESHDKDEGPWITYINFEVDIIYVHQELMSRLGGAVILDHFKDRVKRLAIPRRNVDNKEWWPKTNLPQLSKLRNVYAVDDGGLNDEEQFALVKDGASRSNRRTIARLKGKFPEVGQEDLAVARKIPRPRLRLKTYWHKQKDLRKTENARRKKQESLGSAE